MLPIEHDTTLLYKYEVLRAKMEIRDLFLDNIVKEVYENLGQDLSLVRVQLASLETKFPERINDSLSPSSELIGKSIRNLKLMCRNFHPDVELSKKHGFVDGLTTILHVLKINHVPKIHSKGVVQVLPEDLQLFILNMLRDIFQSIQQVNGDLQNLEVNFKTDKVEIVIRYIGQTISWNSSSETITDDSVPLSARAKLIDGEFFTKNYKSDKKRFILEIPIKTA